MNAPQPPDSDDPPGRTPSPLPRRGRTTALYAQVPVPDPRTPGDGPGPAGTDAPLPEALLPGVPTTSVPHPASPDTAGRHRDPPHTPEQRDTPPPADPTAGAAGCPATHAAGSPAPHTAGQPIAHSSDGPATYAAGGPAPHAAGGPATAAGDPAAYAAGIPAASAAPTVPVPLPGPPRTPPMPWSAVAAGPTVLPPAPGRPPRVATWWAGARRALSRRTLERRVALGLAVTVVLVASAVVALAVVTGPAGDDRPVAGAAAGAPAAGDVAAGAVVEDPAAYGTDVLTFRSPTGNIGCRIDDGGARCTVANQTWAPPAGTADCPADGAAVVLGVSGPATVACDAPVAATAPALSYDRALRHGDVTCVSRRDGVECRDSATGHGFAVARARYRLD